MEEGSPAESMFLLSPATPTSTEPEPQADGPCQNYEVDLAAAEFGACKCGFSKAQHTKATDARVRATGSTTRTDEHAGVAENSSQLQDVHPVCSITCTSSETVKVQKKQHTAYVLEVAHGGRVFVVKKRWAQLYDDLGSGLSHIKWKQCTGLRWDDHHPKATLAKKLFSSNDKEEIGRRIDEINRFLDSVSQRFPYVKLLPAVRS